MSGNVDCQYAIFLCPTVTPFIVRLFQISCMSGFDGGLPQQFEAVAKEASSGHEVSSVRSAQLPFFHLSDLRPGTRYHVLLAAVNAKGRSSAKQVTVKTLKEKKQIAETRAKGDGAWVMVLVVASLTLGVLLVVLVLVFGCTAVL